MADQSNDLSTDVEAIAPVIAMPSTTVPQANTNTMYHTLLDLLTRWVFVETFVWTTNDVVVPMNLSLANYVASAPTALKSYMLPQMILDNSSLVRQKLNNYLLLKSDVEVDIKVNATPFQQGAILIAYFPRSLNTTKFRGDGSEFLASITSAPHRIIQLEQGNTATLTLPYANVVDYIDLSDPDNSYGSFKIYALSPLTGALDTESTNITVRARFVNPVVEAPTDNSIMNIARYAEMESARILAKISAPKRIAGLRAQAGTEGTKTGPVTRIASFIGTIATALGAVPVISTAASVVGWVARMVAGVASIYGWSKPVDLIMPTVVIQRPAAYMGNVEGKDYSNMLAQIADNAVDPSSMIPEKDDEMALAKIWARPNVIARITVPKLQFKSRDLLFSWEVSPWSTLMTQLDSGGQDFCLGSFSFSALMYRMWRGSIHYSLSCVKTPYHSGRIMAVYFPNRVRGDIPDTYDETMTTNNNVIFDLTAKSDDEFSLSKPIEVPYTSNEPWKQTMYYDPELLAYRANTLKTHCGVIGVYCINELVSPETVASEVTFLLSHQAGSDFQVGIPQLQLAGGFAIPVSQLVAQKLATAINANVPENMSMDDVAAGGITNMYDNVAQENEIITQQSGQALWNSLAGLDSTVPDGTYPVTLFLAFSGNGNWFTDTDVDFSVEIRDGQIIALTSDVLVTATATNSGAKVTITASVPVRIEGLRAQSGNDAGSDETPSAQYIAPISPSNSIAVGTTGEYALSLRPLLKRTIHTRNLSGPVTINNLEFNSVAATAPTDVGKRSWAGVNSAGVLVGGGLLPESWINLVSYLYRFTAGSSRSKIFLPWESVAKTSLVLDEDLRSQFGSKQTDPMFVQHGVVNYCLETTVPYYSQYRARTIGDQARGLIANQYIEVTGTTNDVEYHECGGDDLSYFFMIGPPVMHGTRVDVVPIPTISPSSRNLKGVL
jgi:hypothetical protein